MRDSTESTALFPRPLAAPLGLIPERLHSGAVAAVLNRVLASELRAGELDFLHGRTLRIHVQDMRLALRLTLQHGRLAPAGAHALVDLSISGPLHAFLLLVARREDADTLFFRRRLRIEGDTALGLALKNCLDGLDIDAHRLPRQLGRMALPLYERACGRPVGGMRGAP